MNAKILAVNILLALGVCVGRDSGAALDTRLLIGRHTPMANDTSAFALCLYVYLRLSRFERLIHGSTWKVNSPKLDFRFTEFSEVRLTDAASR
jgi:hypothetical protein